MAEKSTIRQALSQDMVVRVKLGFVIFIGAILLAAVASFWDVRNKATENSANIKSIETRLSQIDNDNIDTRVQLAEIKVTLENIAVSIEELKAK